MMHSNMQKNEILMVVLMLFLGFIAMFLFVQNIMLARWNHLQFAHVNKTYMALLMSTVMMQIETLLVIALMPTLWKPMLILFIGATVATISITIAIRKQFLVDDRQFAAGMIGLLSVVIIVFCVC